MTRIIIFIAVLLTIPGCNQSAVPKASVRTDNETVKALSQAEDVEPIDFALLLEELKDCNEKELSYFDQNWGDLHAKLKRAANNNQLAKLPMPQQEEIWDTLDFLQGCRHPDILHKHGADMVKILFCFGTEDQLTILRQIHPDGAPDAR